MPWCGYWGTAGSTFWWLLPLIGLVLMGVMFFICSRHFGGVWCMGGRRHRSDDLAGLQREVEGLKEEIRRLQRPPNGKTMSP